MNQKNFKRLINIIYLVLALGMLTFVVVSYALNQQFLIFEIPPTDDVFLFIVPIVLISGISLGTIVYKRMLHPVQNATLLRQKTTVALTASISRFALIEGSVLISTIAFLGTANLFYGVFIMIGLMYYLTLKPSDKKLRRDLNLTQDEADQLGIL